MDAALHPHERAAVKLRRLWWLLFGLALASLLGLAGAYLIWSARGQRRIETILASAAQRGEPTTGGELNAFYRPPEGQPDATTLWVAGFAPLRAPDYVPSATAVPFVGGDERSPAQVAEPLAPPELASAKEHLNSYSDSLRNFHEAAALGGAARLPVDFRGGLATLLPYTQAAHDAARLLLLDLCVSAQQQDARACAKSLRTLLILPRCLEREPCVISQNICSVIERLGVEALASLVGAVVFTEEELADFDQILASRQLKARLKQGLVGERVMGVEAMSNPEELRDHRISTLLPITTADLALYLEHIERLIAASQCDFPEALSAAEQAQDKLDAESSEGLAYLTSELTRMMTPDFKKNYFLIGARTESANRAGRALIAAERFRRSAGKPPQSLEELVPQFLAAPPVDPFTGKSMRYRLDAQGCTIYSVGENGADDGGVDLEVLDFGLRAPLAP